MHALAVLALASLLIVSAHPSVARADPPWSEVSAGVALTASRVSVYPIGGGLFMRVTRAFDGTRMFRRVISLEAQGLHRTGQEVSAPEYHVRIGISWMTTALLGIESQGTIRGDSGPYLLAGIGLAYIDVAPASEQVLYRPQDVTYPRERSLLPAFAVGAGFRRVPGNGGINLLIDGRVILVPGSRFVGVSLPVELGVAF